jgi:cell division protein FtsI (penicillin-binding protein 3)
VNIKTSILLRVRIAFLLVVLGSTSIVYRIFDLQVVQGQKWAKVARQNILQNREVKATRGNIYSDNGGLMATSLPFYRVAFDPTIVDQAVFNEKVDSLSMLLSNFYRNRSAEEYSRKLRDYRNAKKRFMYLGREFINYQEKKKMLTWPIFREGRLKGGVIFEKVDTRYLPFNQMARRTVGYITEDSSGAGLEYSFNKQLAGVNGVSLFRKVSGGSWKPVPDGSEVRPVEGLDIQTTIDINLQDVAETALHNALLRHQANYGCVVVMEVKTGHIKAIANLGANGRGGYVEDYNYAVGSQGRTDPGSTFKLASYLALFEETSLIPEDSIDTGNGKFDFYGNYLTDTKPGGYGKITLQEAFEKSSNIAISKLINDQFGKNPQRFIDYIKTFGLASPLDFQMIGEAQPYIKNPYDPTWSGITLPWMSVGYELQLSPLQILALYNAVANDGKMIQPIIVKETRKADKVLDTYEAAVINEKICSDKSLSKVRRMLEGVVERGTASNIRGTAYKIAGKTGTSQKIKNGKYIKSYYTSFAGYFPANKPKYSCIVVIDNPQGVLQYGSDVAAPVFKEVADKIYSLDVEMHKPLKKKQVLDQGVFPLIQAGNLHDLTYLCNELGVSNHNRSQSEDWVRAVPVNNAVIWKSNEANLGKMPDVRGMTFRDALFVLENSGLLVRFNGAGRVQEQSQAPGTRVLKGSTINLRLG